MDLGVERRRFDSMFHAFDLKFKLKERSTLQSDLQSNAACYGARCVRNIYALSVYIMTHPLVGSNINKPI